MFILAVAGEGDGGEDAEPFLSDGDGDGGGVTLEGVAADKAAAVIRLDLLLVSAMVNCVQYWLSIQQLTQLMTN